MSPGSGLENLILDIQIKFGMDTEKVFNSLDDLLQFGDCAVGIV